MLDCLINFKKRITKVISYWLLFFLLTSYSYLWINLLSSFICFFFIKTHMISRILVNIQMESFAKILIGFKPFAIVVKLSILDVFRVPRCTTESVTWVILVQYLIHYVLVLPSYRNQSIDWFLYEGNTGT